MQSVKHLPVAERMRPATRVGGALDLALSQQDRGRQGAPRDHEHRRHHGHRPEIAAQLRGASVDTSQAVARTVQHNTKGLNPPVASCTCTVLPD